MDRYYSSSDQSSSGRSTSTSNTPRRELQGPRPTPLKVNKESHKIRKPPLAPPQGPVVQPQSQPQQPRLPVIIYTVSPKIIHTNPSDFRNLVQRLTGLSSSSNNSDSSSSNIIDIPSQDHMNYNMTRGATVSPAARYAMIKKAARAVDNDRHHGGGQRKRSSDVDDHHNDEVERLGIGGYNPAGILSPGPALLPQIPTSFFSPPCDPSPWSLFCDMSPVLQGSSRNFIMGGNSFMPSPSSFHVSPLSTSPTPSFDLFNNFQEKQL